MSTAATDVSCERRYCWVCFASEDEEQDASWVQPCKCRGTTKWVHQGCLQRWIDEKQAGNSAAKVACPQCSSEYVVVLPSLGGPVYVLDLLDRTVHRACPFVAAGLLMGSVYWTAVTYGAVTVMQVLGHKQGLSVMEQADPLFLLVGLPSIPVVLVLARMVRWEDYLLRLWWRHSAPLAKLLVVPPHDPVSATRLLCGALLLPTVASLLGRLFFSRQSSLQRSLLGGLAFVALKGAAKIYLKRQQYLRQCRRTVLNFEGPEPSL
ncbi:hypothetical protein HPB47_022008 [Ixodes persulcatus]|uniref:E3 ubiquitin-protein ligase MARCHF5 n=2 Tax=Ixodes TaxID=6944 RepID=A0A131YAS8_IXORI|nr:E3 ubiquitin-protein ligase MARCHF5 [Ixodes scapularis]KAG0431211.1 hypothetical protein HPB47_022008 [Ixodes persulcatus]